MQTSARMRGRYALTSGFCRKASPSAPACSSQVIICSVLLLLRGGGVPEGPIRTPAGIQLVIEVREGTGTCTREKDGFFLSLQSVMRCPCALTRRRRARGARVRLTQRGDIRRRRAPRRVPGSPNYAWKQQPRRPCVASSAPGMRVPPRARTHRRAVTYSCLLCNDPQCSDLFSHLNNPPLPPLTTLFTHPHPPSPPT